MNQIPITMFAHSSWTWQGLGSSTTGGVWEIGGGTGTVPGECAIRYRLERGRVNLSPLSVSPNVAIEIGAFALIPNWIPITEPPQLCRVEAGPVVIQPRLGVQLPTGISIHVGVAGGTTNIRPGGVVDRQHAVRAVDIPFHSVAAGVHERGDVEVGVAQIDKPRHTGSGAQDLAAAAW